MEVKRLFAKAIITITAIFVLSMLSLGNIVAYADTETATVENESTVEPSIGYTKANVHLRTAPNMEAGIVIIYPLNTEVKYVDVGDGWCATINVQDETFRGYIKSELIAQEKTEFSNPVPQTSAKLTKRRGVFRGPNGKETYYNLNMKNIIRRLSAKGYEGSYWIREDGAKMYGDYIMVAANWKRFPYGSIVDTSLGKGIVCDTGAFARNGSGITFDIATAW